MTNQEVVNYFIELRGKCIDEIVNKKADGQLIVSIIRDYNRIWNKNENLIKDGFLKLMKRHLEKIDLPDSVKKCIYYL